MCVTKDFLTASGLFVKMQTLPKLELPIRSVAHPRPTGFQGPRERTMPNDISVAVTSLNAQSWQASGLTFDEILLEGKFEVAGDE
jgi:hypothetical protein